MHRVLLISSLVLVLGSAALAGASIESPCGGAAVSDSVECIGGVCVSVCGQNFGYNGCMSSQELTGLQQLEIPAPSIDLLSIRIFGENLSVSELAMALQNATGWTIDVSPKLKTERLRPAKKRMDGGKSRSLRFRLQDGGKLLVNIDDEQKQLTVVKL